jgi:hypothetical protein
VRLSTSTEVDIGRLYYAIAIEDSPVFQCSSIKLFKEVKAAVEVARGGVSMRRPKYQEKHQDAGAEPGA